ncbi:ECA4, partial [Symbiodinium sp. CCMP2456]
MRTGEDLELPTTVADFASSMEFGDGLGIMILEVPAAVSKKPISGKDGAKLLELCLGEEYGL